MLPLQRPVLVAIQFPIIVQIVPQREADRLVRGAITGVEGHHSGTGRGEAQVAPHVLHRLLKIGFEFAADLQALLNPQVVDQQREGCGNDDDHD